MNESSKAGLKPSPRGGRIGPGLLASLCSLLLALPTGLFAQEEASKTREQTASTHFDRGVELYSEGSLDAALVEFERAYELVPSYKLLYNLAQIQAERHEYTEASRLFEKYLAEGGSQISEARQAEARAELAKLRERIAQLWVESDVDGAELFVNDVLVAKLPLTQSVPINPGISRIRVEKAGHRAATRELKATGGDTPRLTMPLRQFGDDDAMAAEAASDGRQQANYTPLWVASSATVALAAATLSLGLVARAADRQLDRELDRFPPDERRLSDDRAKLKMFAGLTDGFAVATAVGVGVSIYFAVAPPRGARNAGASTRDTLTKSLRLVPSGRGVGLHGSF